jgi:general stress protein 26
MEVATFAELAEEFTTRINKAVWCCLSTVDSKGRPRSRIVHPVWEGTTGWITSRRETLKAKHIANNPHVAIAYVADVAKPVYVDGTAEWIDDLAEKARVWDFLKNTPPPMGFDLGTMFPSVDAPNFGLLKITPWRVEVATLPSSTQVWHAK